jgi:hypothetical protein
VIKISMMVLVLLGTLIAFEIPSFTFGYKGDSNRVDKNFVADENKSIVTDKLRKKVYYDFTPDKKMDFYQAGEYCDKLTYLDSSTWSVPSKEDMRSLLENSRRDIRVKHAFKNIKEGCYWTSTPSKFNTAWYIDFDLGRYSTYNIDKDYFVICVKDEEK